MRRSGGGPTPLPKAWRLGNRPNLTADAPRRLRQTGVTPDAASIDALLRGVSPDLRLRR